MSKTSPTARELLLALGVGQFNATQVIPYLFIAPATTDPKAGQIIILVQNLQQELNRQGAGLQITGYLDEPTAGVLEQLVGPGWEQMSWFMNIDAVLKARGSGALQVAPAMDRGMPMAVGGPLDFLPDVPGGLVTYAVAGYLLWRHFRKAAS